jgi:hypothetical protein
MRFAVAVVILGLFLIGGIYISVGKSEGSLPVLAKDEIVILRTPGGLLEVSTLVRTEEFRWQTTYTCLPIDCASLLGATITDVRVPVHYTYRIPLATSWQLQFKADHFDLLTPQVQPILPPAVDLARIEFKTKDTWLSPGINEHREVLLRNLTPETEKRAMQKNYIDAQRDDARKTIVEFAQKWMIEQNVDPGKRGYPIRVYFPDDARNP